MGGFCLQRKNKKRDLLLRRLMLQEENNSCDISFFNNDFVDLARSIHLINLHFLRNAISSLDCILFGETLLARNFRYTAKIAALCIKLLVKVVPTSFSEHSDQLIILRLSNMREKLSVLQVINLLEGSPIALSRDFCKLYFRDSPLIRLQSGFKFDENGKII